MPQPLLPSEIARLRSGQRSRSASWSNVKELHSVRDLRRLTGPLTFLEQGQENIYFRDGDDQTWFFKFVGQDAELNKLVQRMRMAKHKAGPMSEAEKKEFFEGNPQFKEMNENPPDSVLKVREQMQGKNAKHKAGPMSEGDKKKFFESNPQFQEMNENPPESVLKVREKMQGKTAYLDPQSASEVKHLLSHVLAALRAQYMMYQTLHWQAKGPTAYGDHLLFERLYKSTKKEIDQAAEKLVGYTGADSVFLPAQLSLIQVYCSRWCAIENPFERGLHAEKDLQNLLKFTYNKLKSSNSLTLGLDDWIMATSSNHETNQYLLQQVQA